MSQRSFWKKLLFAILALCLSVAGVLAQEGTGRKVRSKVEPRYPEIAKRFHLSGTVKVQVVITPAGSVKSAKAIGGHPVLADAAVDAAMKWKFEPANDDTTQIIPFSFVE